MPNTLAVFPGQGSQKLGMGGELLREFPKSKLSFEAAEDAAKLPISKLCLEGPKEDLALTEFQQPCILTLSIAIWKTLCDETGLGDDCEVFAGHSLGEYSALVASGRLDFEAAVALVHLRGQAMQRAVPSGLGGMAAVLNFDSDQLIEICATATENSANSLVEVVNFNAPGQQIISGHKDLVDQVCADLKGRKIRTMPLPISAPFHSGLMKPAKMEMSKHLTPLDLSQGRGQIIANLNGLVHTHYKNPFLIEQIDNPVLWTKSMATAGELPITKCVEVGPGKVLSGLAKRCSLDSKALIVDSDDIKKCIEILGR